LDIDSQFDCKIRTAFYRCVQTSVFSLQAHIQLAESDNPSNHFLIGAQTIFDNASAMAVLLPATGQSMPQRENVPIEVATPFFT
jgi:hypothetical protein